MANVYTVQNKHSEACEYLEKAIRIRQNTLGKNHPDEAISYSDMADSYMNTLDRTKALEYYEILLAIRLETLGGNHPDVAEVYKKMCEVDFKKGDMQKGEYNSDKALDIKVSGGCTILPLSVMT